MFLEYIEPEKDFVKVPHILTRDSSLGDAAKVLAIWLSSHTPDFLLDKNDRYIAKCLGWGQDKLLKARKRLAEAGFLAVSRDRDGKGRYGNNSYVLKLNAGSATEKTRVKKRTKRAKATENTDVLACESRPINPDLEYPDLEYPDLEYPDLEYPDLENTPHYKKTTYEVSISRTALEKNSVCRRDDGDAMPIPTTPPSHLETHTRASLLGAEDTLEGVSCTKPEFINWIKGETDEEYEQRYLAYQQELAIWSFTANQEISLGSKDSATVPASFDKPEQMNNGIAISPNSYKSEQRNNERAIEKAKLRAKIEEANARRAAEHHKADEACDEDLVIAENKPAEVVSAPVSVAAPTSAVKAAVVELFQETPEDKVQDYLTAWNDYKPDECPYVGKNNRAIENQVKALASQFTLEEFEKAVKALDGDSKKARWARENEISFSRFTNLNQPHVQECLDLFKEKDPVSTSSAASKGKKYPDYAKMYAHAHTQIYGDYKVAQSADGFDARFAYHTDWLRWIKAQPHSGRFVFDKTWDNFEADQSRANQTTEAYWKEIGY
jgi:hypothetical protein